MRIDQVRPTGRSVAMVRTARALRWLVEPVTVLLVVTLVGQLPARAAEPWQPPQPKEVTGVRVTAAEPPAARAAWSAERRAVRGPRPVDWPQPGAATADPGTPGRQRAGSLPVTVAADAPDTTGRRVQPTPGPVRVTVHNRAATERAGVRGVLVSLRGADTASRSGRVSVGVDYSGFAHAYGGDWAARLRLVQRPACVLETPQLPACQTATVLPTRNETQAQRLTAAVGVSTASSVVLAAEAGPTGDNGDYSATDLTAAGTWQVSHQTGDFSWSYDLRVPPALGGPAPNVRLSYSSGSLDGRTAMTNNQGGWVGDGWESWSGFIERKYASCSDDNPDHKTGDQCWFSDNATLSLNGRAGELIRDGSVWRLKSDDGTKIERTTDAARANGDDDNEYWKVTTPDGVQYFFGYHRLPGWATGDPVTNSTWTAPVYGNNTSEPCYNATFADARCDQAWRWNLDYVVDPHNNTMAYYYQKETGAYGRNATATQRTTYDRGGWLQRIEYGTRRGAEYSAAAPLRIVFDTRERCLADCWKGAAWTSDPKPSAWPDTPWDQYCDAEPCTEELTATFWSARRLAKVTAQVRNGTTTYRDVESWALRHEFLNAGTGESTPMWLRGVTRTGHVTTAGGVEVTDPEVTFDPGAEPLANRVDGPNDQRTELNRWRIKAIRTESGGDILVTYSGRDCTRGNLPTEHTNTRRCMPTYYSWPGTGDPKLDWFHKYVVTRIDQDDLVTDQPTQTTFYDYLDDPAWAYTTDELTKDKHRTWSDWRGYGRVRVRQGDPTNGTQTAVEYRYLRGMHGDKLPNGTRDVSVPDTWGGSITDHEALQGFLRQEITTNGPTGAEVSSTRNDPWRRGPTATRTRNKVTTNAYMVNTGTARTRTALAAGGFRTTGTVTTYNDDGLPTAIDDRGDESKTGDETCTRTTYARNESIWMLDKVNQTEVLSVRCTDATSPAAPATVLKRDRSFYDKYVDASSFGAAPTQGNVVRTEELDKFNGSAPVYVRSATTVYDPNGRVTAQTNARDYTTGTAYTTAHGGLITQTVVTDPMGHTTTTVREPAWNLATKTIDANEVATELAYDGLGRLTDVWLPGRVRTQSPNNRIRYQVRNTGDPTSVTTESLLVTGSSYRKTVELYDGFLRQRQVQTQATGGGRLLTDTLYNTRGELDWTSEPYYDTTNAAPAGTLGRPQGQIPSITAYGYDGAGRKTAEVFKALGAEKWRVTTAYGGDRVHTTPPQGGTATTALNDARGNTIALRQYRSHADVGSNDPATFDQTRYTYTLLGQQESVIDAAENSWIYGYDLRGRKTQVVDPDQGTITSTYDGNDNLETQTAPLGTGTATIAHTYDALDRRTTTRDGSITGTIRAEWKYDSLPYGKGKITSATRVVDGQSWVSRTDSYDSYGRPTSTSMVVPSSQPQLCAAAAPSPCVYTTTTSYRANGQLHQVTLPAVGDLPAERLTHGYTDVGDEGTLLSPEQIYVGSVTYNKLGQLTGREFGAYGSRIVVTSEFDEPTRRRISTNVVPESRPEAARWTYAYDKVGNITGITEAGAGQPTDTQCYRYDHLRRVTSAWTPASGDCTTDPEVAELGGPAPYRQSWSFDAIGNRLTETRHATNPTTYTYHYPAARSPKPHTVTEVTATGAVSWTRPYTYDKGGNTETRPTGSGATQKLTWSPEGDLETVTEGAVTTRYRYDAEGNRLTRTDATGQTIYLPGGTELRYTTADGSRKATRYYTHGGDTVACRTSAGLNWIVGDHHGTAELTIAASTLAVAKRRTMPYGDPRGPATGTWPTAMDKGFVGGTQDPTGLTHLGAREYDPFLGRFLSVDPVIDVSDPQQMHGYAYSNNAPPTFTDPDGLWPKLKVPGFISNAVDAVVARAGTISTVLGTAALACSVIPPLQVLAPALSIASLGFSVVDTVNQCVSGNGIDCALGAASLVPGYKAARLGMKLKGIYKAKGTIDKAHKNLSKISTKAQKTVDDGGHAPDSWQANWAQTLDGPVMNFADDARAYAARRLAEEKRILGDFQKHVVVSNFFLAENVLFSGVSYASGKCDYTGYCDYSREQATNESQPRQSRKPTQSSTPKVNNPPAPANTPSGGGGAVWKPGRIGGI
jgi:RHS repeat-associated protein